MIKSKRAQISEGITWIVATIAIIIILLFSVFITSLISSKDTKIKADYFNSNINQKSFLSYLLTNENSGKTIYSEITAEEKINNANGNLAIKVFRDLYKDNYIEIWFGISNLGTGVLGGTSLNGVENEFFGKKPKLTAAGAFGAVASKEADSSVVKFADKKFLEVIFVK